MYGDGRKMIVKVKEIMKRNPITVSGDMPVLEAAKILLEHDITGMPVVDSLGRIVGMLSEYDIIGKNGSIVTDVMSRDAIVIDSDTSLEQSARIMFEQRIRRLPVVDSGVLVGIITRKDLIKFYVEHEWVCSDCEHAQHGFSAPARCEVCGGNSFRLQKSHDAKSKAQAKTK
jgi:CBS domain-containing protein